MVGRLGDRTVRATPRWAGGAPGCRVASWSVALVLCGLVMSASALPDGTVAQLGGGEQTEAVAFSPNVPRLAVATATGVELWDVDTRVLEDTLQTDELITSVAFSPDGTLLAGGGITSTVWLWDVGTGTHLATLSGHPTRVESVAFSPDGRTLASGGWGGMVKLWDVATRAEIGSLVGHSWAIEAVEFSPDGVLLTSGSWDGTVRLWDLDDQTEVASFADHSSLVPATRFSPSGATVATGSWEEVKLWDTETFEEIGLSQVTLTTSGRWRSRQTAMSSSQAGRIGR